MTTITLKEGVVKIRAKGTFEVKVRPIATQDGVDTGGFARLSLDKEFSGDLMGTSLGQMMATGTAVEGSAAYVALERVTGTLDGRTGSFILQHTGTMSHRGQVLTVNVVPDSGTGELTGLTGAMNIIIDVRQHFYEFEFTFEN